MGFYKPCRNCARDKDTCEIRNSLRHAIKGHHVTSINFRCDQRLPMFTTGQRVVFSWSHWEPNDWGYSDENKLLFTGTVAYEKGSKFVVRVDDTEGVAADEVSEAMPSTSVFKSLIIKVRTNDMQAIDEPNKVICLACMSYRDEPEKCHGHGDPNKWDSYWPTECLSPPETRGAG